MRRVPEVDEVVQRIQKKMKPWGITLSYLAGRLGVSRQYAWQIVHYRTILSRAKALEIEKAVDTIIDERAHVRTFGDRLRAARISAGYTLKDSMGASLRLRGRGAPQRRAKASSRTSSTR